MQRRTLLFTAFFVLVAPFALGTSPKLTHARNLDITQSEFVLAKIAAEKGDPSKIHTYNHALAKHLKKESAHIGSILKALTPQSADKELATLLRSTQTASDALEKKVREACKRPGSNCDEIRITSNLKLPEIKTGDTKETLVQRHDGLLVYVKEIGRRHKALAEIPRNAFDLRPFSLKGLTERYKRIQANAACERGHLELDTDVTGAEYYFETGLRIDEDNERCLEGQNAVRQKRTKERG